MVPDFDLLHRWRAGDAEAGRELFARHFDGVSRFFRNKVDDDVAADLVQATFLACVEHKNSFREDCTFRTFLFAVARKRLYSWFEARMRRRIDDESDVDSVASLGATPSQLLGLKHEHTLLLHALRAIPLPLQALLELHYWERLAGPELAEVFGVPEGTVRTRLRRAKQLLLEKVAELSAGAPSLETTETRLEQWAAGVRDQIAARR